MQGNGFSDLAWYALHQPETVSLGGRLVNIVYPVLPWIGLMALGYVCGAWYSRDFPPERRRRTLLVLGIGAILLFILLRGFDLYGEPNNRGVQASPLFTVMAFLNTTKYPPSLQFLLMTMGPALVFLSRSESLHSRVSVIGPVLTFGRVPFFFYIVHLYLIHVIAMLWLLYSGRDWHEYILSAAALRSGALSNFGLSLSGVYLVWILVIALLYPLCSWYQKYKENNPSNWWLSYV
jgi:uncharacterized membrane protein